MRPLIFLDIDGVLSSTRFIAENTGGEGVIIVDGELDATAHIDPACVARLDRLIYATSAIVVLSSSWRLLFGREKTQRSLKAKGFAHELADVTPRLHGEPRHREIAAYLSSYPARPFVVLDDEEEAGIDARFVHVRDGLEDEHVERALQVLRAQGVEVRPSCLLCVRSLSTVEAPRDGDRPEVLVCGAHSDAELDERDLGELWAGFSTPPGILDAALGTKLVGAWALGPGGAYAVHLLLDGGDLFIVTPSYGGVDVFRVRRDQRLLERPLGVDPHADPPWPALVAGRATLASVRRDDGGRVRFDFPGHGAVTFGTEQYSWGELGNGSHFLDETWSPAV